jgi:hypothetical protein
MPGEASARCTPYITPVPRRSFARLVWFASCAASVTGAAAAAADRPSIAIVSGTPQSAQAFIAQHGLRYETTFGRPLVVKVSPAVTTVRFRCATSDCIFAPSVQPEGVSRVDPRTYDVKSEKGVASIKLIISTATVEAVTVTATPAGTGRVPAVRFRLTER